jgi:YegS/Rv2252/BmrU family lipid kinase
LKTFVVLNPNAAGGTAARDFEALQDALRAAIGPFEVGRTTGRGHATALARQAVEAGAEQVVAVGGDGTINETVNGLLRDGETRSDVVLGLVVCGTGGDFRRNFGLEGPPSRCVRRLADGQLRRIDLGRLSYVDNDGREAVRLFANIADFGLGGLTAQKTSRKSAMKRAGGKLSFTLATLSAFAGYRFQSVGMEIDGEPAQARIATVAVCNGGWFGGGMHVAPDARPDDGLFDVVVMRARPKLAMVADMSKIYAGTHVAHPSVSVQRARSVAAWPLDEARTGPVLLDVDGEDLGRLPARFEILPGAIQLRC